MSKDLNDCKFIGRLGQDIELKTMPFGQSVVNFSLACNDDYKDKQTGQKVEKVNWVDFVAFGRLAEILAEYTQKGSQVFVSGKWSKRKWQDQNGQDRYTTEIVANEMQMLGGRAGGEGYVPNAGAAAPPQQPAPAAPPSMESFDDDIPF
jgi:single-strand DNA-binding protein